MLKEFKEFAIKGNVIDLAVGVIVGSAFGTVVKSLVDDIIMPPIGFVLGNVDFANLFIVIKDGSLPGPYNTTTDAAKAGAIAIKYGLFINTLVSFIIISFSIFIFISQLNRLKKNASKSSVSASPVTETKEVLLLSEIRDLLKNPSPLLESQKEGGFQNLKGH